MTKFSFQDPILLQPGDVGTGGGMMALATLQNSQRAIIGFVTKSNTVAAVFDASTPMEEVDLQKKLQLVESAVDFKDPSLRLFAVYGDLQNVLGMEATNKAAQFAERVMAKQVVMRCELEEIHYSRPMIIRFLPDGEVRQEPLPPPKGSQPGRAGARHRLMPRS